MVSLNMTGEMVLRVLLIIVGVDDEMDAILFLNRRCAVLVTLFTITDGVVDVLIPIRRCAESVVSTEDCY